MVLLATRKVAMVVLLVLMLSISASKHPTRGTGSLCANANKRVSVGRTSILLSSELWSFPILCSSMILASILPFTPLTRTSTVAQLLGRGLSALTWKVKSESDDSSCSPSWTYFAVDCDFDGKSFWFFLPLHMRTNDLFLNTDHMFFQRRDSLILALCCLYHRIGMHFLSCRCAVAWVCVYLLVSRFSLGEFC